MDLLGLCPGFQQLLHDFYGLFTTFLSLTNPKNSLKQLISSKNMGAFTPFWSINQEF
jgi:hypothetical protein